MPRTKKVVEETTTKKTATKKAASKAAAKSAPKKKGIKESVMETVENPVVIVPTEEAKVEEPVTDIPKIEAAPKIENKSLELIRKIAYTYCGVNIEEYVDVDTVNKMINEVKEILSKYFSDEDIDTIIASGVKAGGAHALKLYNEAMREQRRAEIAKKRAESRADRLLKRSERKNTRRSDRYARKSQLKTAEA